MSISLDSLEDTHFFQMLFLLESYHQPSSVNRIRLKPNRERGLKNDKPSLSVQENKLHSITLGFLNLFELSLMNVNPELSSLYLEMINHHLYYLLYLSWRQTRLDYLNSLNKLAQVCPATLSQHAFIFPHKQHLAYLVQWLKNTLPFKETQFDLQSDMPAWQQISQSPLGSQAILKLADNIHLGHRVLWANQGISLKIHCLTHRSWTKVTDSLSVCSFHIRQLFKTCAELHIIVYGPATSPSSLGDSKIFLGRNSVVGESCCTKLLF